VKQYPLSAFEAAYNMLVMLYSTNEATAQDYTAYLSQQGAPYLNTV
jgi:hypothetical protein